MREPAGHHSWGPYSLAPFGLTFPIQTLNWRRDGATIPQVSGKGMGVSAACDYLELATSGAPPRRLPLEKARVQIGRSAACEIRLGGGYVSRRHARLERAPKGAWRVMDLGSSNGTYVNGQRVQVATLTDGDVMAVGTHRLILHTVADREAAETASGSETEREIVPSVAASVVVDRATLAPDRVVPARLFAEVHEAGRRLSRLGDVPSLLGALAQEVRTLLQPKRIAIGREDGPACEWPVVVGADGLPADGSDLSCILVPRVEALRSSMAVSWDDLAAHKDAEVSATRARSLLFPIVVGSRRLGHVYAELAPKRPVSAETIDLLSLFVRQTALVWENLELQVARRAADQLTHELSAARQIQLQLFPEQRDLDPRLELAAENIPALGVSGDYYDFQLLDPGRVVFVLADVMGHGLPAALLMASVQAVFRTGVRAGWDLLQIDHHIHEAVAASGHGETFVTGVLGLCDLARHSLTLLSAGHHWPSICTSGQLIERHEPACSLPWGIFVERPVQSTTLELAPADWSIVAYTDGVCESALAGGQNYGTQRVTDLHRRHQRRPADEICEEILNDVLGSSDDSAPQQDDITLLVLRSATQSGSAGTPHPTGEAIPPP